jgi:hypothetical protein
MIKNKSMMQGIISISPKKMTKVSSMYNLKQNLSKEIQQKKGEEANENKEEKVKKKTLNKNFSQFLNIQRLEKVEIKNQKLKSILDGAGGLGPYYSKCGTCNNKNLTFYKVMNYDNAEKILSYIKRSSGLMN